MEEMSSSLCKQTSSRNCPQNLMKKSIGLFLFMSLGTVEAPRVTAQQVWEEIKKLDTKKVQFIHFPMDTVIAYVTLLC